MASIEINNEAPDFKIKIFKYNKLNCYRLKTSYKYLKPVEATMIPLVLRVVRC